MMIALAWLATYQIGSQSFEIVPVQSLSFTGPSADMLMLVLSPRASPGISTSAWFPASCWVPSWPDCGDGN